MGQEEKAPERERRDWIIILLLLLLGLLCVILAGGWAIRFSPTWSLNTDMGSNIDPNSDFLTNLPNGFVEPLDPSILTQPAWINVFLTPGASFDTSVPSTSLPTNTPPPTVTIFPTTTSTNLPTPTPTNTFVYIPPSTPTRTPLPPLPTRTPLPPSPTPTFTYTPVSPISADLVITKNDNDGSSTYTQGGTVSYVIVVSNPAGPDSVTGATVTDTFPAQLVSANWTCVPTGGAVCTAIGTGNINDTVDLPVGSFVTYSVTASVSASAYGTITNTATVNMPVGGIEIDSSDNSDSYSDTPSSTEPDIGGPDGNDYNPGPTGSITIVFSPAIVADGDVGTPDFVYYEVVSTPMMVDMDWVMIEISPDGVTWYTVFVWGDGNPDTNSNLNINVIGGTEADNRTIPFATFYNNTGVTIDIDPIPGITTGTSYPWMRISGIGGVDGPNIDAIQPYYP